LHRNGHAPSCRWERVFLEGGRPKGLEELGVGFFGRAVLGEGELGDKDLPGTREHAFFACGYAFVLFSSPDVSDHFGDFVDVAADHLGLVVFEPARPVSGFFDLAGLKEGVDLVDASLVNDVPHSEICGPIDRCLDDEVAAVNPKGHVHVTVHVSETAERLWGEARQLEDEARAVQQRAAQLRREAVRLSRTDGYKLDAVAAAFGVTPGRIQQLASDPAAS